MMKTIAFLSGKSPPEIDAIALDKGRKQYKLAALLMRGEKHQRMALVPFFKGKTKQGEKNTSSVQKNICFVALDAFYL